MNWKLSVRGLSWGGSRLLAGVAVCALLTGMGPLSGWSAEQLVVYSGRGEKFTKPVVKAFSAATGVEVQTLVSNAGQLLARIQVEGERTPADVFMSNYAGTLDRARRLGLLQPYASPMLKHIPERYVGPQRTWFGASARARAIVYNTDIFSKQPVRSMLELAEPRWRGKLGITVSTNGSFVGGLATMIGQHGEKRVRAFLEGIKANAGDNVFPKHTPIVSAVARGEIALGLVNHYYYYRAIAKNGRAPLGIIFPDQDGAGAPTTISGLAILKHAKHLDAARKFVDFVLSPRGQRLFAEVNYEIPVSRDVMAHRLLPPRDSIRLAPVGQGLKVESIDLAIELIRTVGMQ
ncbi:MAG: extracellular solute-binding protein [SAR324 cluster bacterium]|nr:extracellular solute-binding protein [SAR324 cluster bacterium]